MKNGFYELISIIENENNDLLNKDTIFYIIRALYERLILIDEINIEIWTDYINFEKVYNTIIYDNK